MKCPIDGSELRIADRHGIEIDYCPQCRGVWLDRGELDKIIERAAMYEQPQQPQRPAAPAAPPTAPQPPHPAQAQPPYVKYDDDYWEDYYKRNGHYPKRKSFLGEVFDIFD